MFVAIHCHEPLVGVYPNPRFAQKTLRLRVQRTLFMHPRIFKITCFRKESGDFLFNKKEHHLIYCLSHKI